MILFSIDFLRGHFAPNHKLTWPWRFTVVGREGRVKIADRAVELKSR